MTDKSKSPTSPSFPPTADMASLSITPSSPPPQPSRPNAPPPRPSAMSKPTAASPHLALPGSGKQKAVARSDSEDDSEDEDENDPFADRNAVVTPKVERAEPTW